MNGASVRQPFTLDDQDKLLSGGGYTFSGYDGNGSPATVATPTGTLSFTYDKENRPRTVTNSSGTSTYRYDGDGRRVERVDSSGTTRFVYDGSGIVAETSGSVIQTYHVPGISQTTANGQRYFVRESSLGSQLNLTGDNAQVLSRTAYDAFGVETNITSGPKGNFKFAGKHGYVTDDQTGMQLLGARFYLPALGRFLTQDPIGQEGGLNVYAYCNPDLGICSY